MDPALKVWYDCPMMMTENKDVASGKANGTQVILKKVVLKHQQQISYIHINSIKVKALYAAQIDHDLVEHANNKNLLPFQLQPQYFSFTAKLINPSFLSSSSEDFFPMPMKTTQILLICNVATTCHKLQGSERENLLVALISYSKNWPYVALSRVRNIRGLF